MSEAVIVLGTPPFALVEALRECGMRCEVHDAIDFEAMVLDPPEVLVVCANLLDPALLVDLRNDLMLRRLLVFAVVDRDDVGALDWEHLPLDDFVVWPGDAREAASRIRLAIVRHARTFDVNPLSGLAGNTTILHESQHRLASGHPFGLAYADVDHFKSFNDRYGYDRGDEVLRAVCRLMATAVHDVGGRSAFLGHLGGDDFVIMSSPKTVEDISRALIGHFDAVISSFYDDDDRMRGGIDSVDRQGNPQHFPIMTLSVAIVTNEHRKIAHVGELSLIASQLKKKLKPMPGSNMLKDRRHS